MKLPGPTLVQSLIEADLVDELRLVVYPVGASRQRPS